MFKTCKPKGRKTSKMRGKMESGRAKGRKLRIPGKFDPWEKRGVLKGPGAEKKGDGEKGGGKRRGIERFPGTANLDKKGQKSPGKSGGVKKGSKGNRPVSERKRKKIPGGGKNTGRSSRRSFIHKRRPRGEKKGKN